MYALILTLFLQNWGFLTINALLPTYFGKVLHMNLKNVIINKNFLLKSLKYTECLFYSDKNGILTSLLYVFQAIVGWISSIISDKIRKRGNVSVNTIRKTNSCIGKYYITIIRMFIVL